jgi:hypothetical protein
VCLEYGDDSIVELLAKTEAHLDKLIRVFLRADPQGFDMLERAVILSDELRKLRAS